MLTFALSFDEVIVATFTAAARDTIPLLILGYIQLGQQPPVVNVIALVMIVGTSVPVPCSRSGWCASTACYHRTTGNIAEAVEFAIACGLVQSFSFAVATACGLIASPIGTTFVAISFSFGVAMNF